MFDIAITNELPSIPVDDDRLRMAARAILEEEGVESASISIAVVNDATIQRLNRDFLDHDYATDVLSFKLEEGEVAFDGEVIVSADTAAATAERFGWTMADELLLYVIHGMLHLVGYDDQDPERLDEMRARERHYLAYFGLVPRYADVTAPHDAVAATSE